MGHRLSKIYTRTGDKGTTGLADGQRIAKHSLRITVLGEIDELNAHIGAVLADKNLRLTLQQTLVRVQHNLFDLGGELAIPNSKKLQCDYVTYIEQQLDAFNLELPYLKEFILPGGHPTAAQTHIARTVCRRAERQLVALAAQEEINPDSVCYINRLSDLLFVIARIINKDNHCQEPYWQSTCSRKSC